MLFRRTLLVLLVLLSSFFFSTHSGAQSSDPGNVQVFPGVAPDWNNIKNIPAGFADGIDNTGAGGSALATEVDGVQQEADTTVYDWANSDFNLVESPASDFDITINDGGIDHDSTANYDANDHIDHTTVTLTAGAGLSGGGTIAANRSFAVDSTEADFLNDGDAVSLTCGASQQGKAQVMGDGDLEWCDGAATPALQSVDAKISTHTSNASAHHVATVDTGPSPDCSGDTTYQDGEGNCDDISSVYEASDADIAKVNEAETITGDWDIGGGTLQIPNSATLPGTCEVGDQYMDTDATSGSRHYLCESANSWVLQGDGSHGDGANCSANNYPLGVDADGAVQSCTADDDTPDDDSEVPDALTIAGGTIGTSTITLVQSANPTPTAEGVIEWETDTNEIHVGDGATTQVFVAGAHTTDTGPSPDCSGTTTYQDGEGNCDDISSVYEAADADIAKVNEAETITGDWDAGGGTWQSPNSATLPASCEVGDTYWDTDADTDGSLFVCNGVNTWKEVDDDGGEGGGGDITDVFNCATGDCSSITIAATDLLNMSGSDASTATEGLILPQHATACAGGTAEGQVCWEADDDTLYIGDGTGLTAVGGAEVNDLEATDPPTILDTEVYIGTGSGTGAFAALSGDVTMDNTGAVTIGANTVALTTDTTGNYAAGDAEAGNALTGDSATAFFSSGEIEDARVVDALTIAGGTIGTSALTLVQGTNPTPTAEGVIEWETDDDHIIVGDGSAQVEFVPAEDVSGDITMTDAGAVTIGANAVALTTDTTGNYVTSITNGSGITGGDGGSEGAALTLAATLGTSIDASEIDDNIVDFAEIKQDNTLAGNPALLVDECFLVATTTGGGLVCEGSTANTNEQLYLFPDVDGADTTNRIVVDNTEVTSVDGTGLTISAGTLSADLGTDISAAEIADGDHGDFTYTSGSAAIDANAVALTADTTGNYVASCTNGTGITGCDGGSEGAALTIAATLGTSIASAEIDANTIVADDVAATLDTRMFSYNLEDPATGDDGNFQAKVHSASTLVRVSCSTTSGSADINLYERAENAPNTGTTSMITSNLTCNSDTTADATTTFTDSAVAADAVLALGIKADSTTGILRVFVEHTID